MINNELNDIIFQYGILNKAFDNIRMVDPVNNKILDLTHTTSEDANLQCFDFWGKKKVCNNCISIRAYHDNRTYVKMEYTTNEVYVVMAIPIELPDRKVVIEIMKNATNSLIVDPNDNQMYTDIQELIDKMNNLALIDSLTGIYNRRYINEKLPAEITKAALNNTNISLIIADIDFFKKVNDTYGHISGDRVLKKFAKVLSQCLAREKDWIARFGGEEFLICLPGVSSQRAVEIAETMRKRVEDSVFDINQNKCQITASFGICTAPADRSSSMEELIDMADAKLYEAKNKGRNRVEA